MLRPSTRAQHVVNHPLGFVWQVLKAFQSNHGLLMAGAVAYNALLSIIPMLALFAVAISQWFDPQLVLSATKDYVDIVAPGKAAPVMRQLQAFLESWQVIGLLGGVTMILFSTFAFSALENALSVIFAGHFAVLSRKMWMSLLLPYAFVLMVGFAFFILTLLTWALGILASRDATQWLPDSHAIAPWLGLIGEAFLFTAIYYVLPPAPVRLKHALIGGVTAAVLWELMRRILIWYFSSLSSVNLIYGTFATVLVIVLSLEIATAILLLGAQVIREYTAIPDDDYSETPRS
ncbi:MAG: YihY/virulence factor BrkB family protein [Acidiferrobacterales bacterium]|jgi:membrane protein|nr:YihY/virulence factor BrkB family protein [Acidiferrobacterales bacterium]